MAWPSIPYPAWRETAAALHMWLQVIGKYRLARTPWVNHSWHATFYVTARGLATGPVPEGFGAVDVEFDLLDHRVLARSSRGDISGFDLEPMSVADFYDRARAAISAVGGSPRIDLHPNEVADPIPFPEDRAPQPYDRDAVERFFGALVAADKVLKRFRTGFLGKASPVHLFWGSFDLAVTRFSGRTAPPHPGGIPALPDAVTREAYSHEVSSAGFWPGDARFEAPAFYAYAYPVPPGFAGADVGCKAAYFDEGLGEFLLPYEEVRALADPEAGARLPAGQLRGRRQSRRLGPRRAGMRAGRGGRTARDRPPTPSQSEEACYDRYRHHPRRGAMAGRKRRPDPHPPLGARRHPAREPRHLPRLQCP